MNVKNNWHAKKVKSKLRDLKKRPFDLPKAIDKAIYDAEKDDYETVTLKDIHNQLVQVSITKETKELMKQPHTRYLMKKSLSLKDMKKVYGEGDFSQQLKTTSRSIAGSIDYRDVILNHGYYLNQTVYAHTFTIGDEYFILSNNKPLMQEGAYTISEIRTLLPKNLLKQFDKKITHIDKRYYKTLIRLDNKKQYITEEKFKKYNEVMKYRDEDVHNRFCFCKYCKNRNKKQIKFKHKNLTQVINSKPLDYQNYIE
mgnify:CR=1 FL=1